MKAVKLRMLVGLVVLSLSLWGCSGDGEKRFYTSGDTQTGTQDVLGPEDVVEQDLAPADGVVDARSPETSDNDQVSETVVPDLYVPVADHYPPAPYGKTVGGVIKNHTFWDPEMDKQLKLSQMYQHSRKRILLINASAGWCVYCKEEAYELRAVYEEHGPRGLEIWFTLFQDYDGQAPTKAFWDKWMNALKPTYPTLLDTAFEMGAYFNVDATPMNMIVDLSSMKIVYLQTGYDKTGLINKINQLLQ